MKIVTAADGKQTVKISMEEWLSLGKTAGWYNEGFTSEPDDSNKYKANYDLFREDSTGCSVSVNEPGAKYPSWMGGSFFKGGFQKVKSTIINTLEKNLPYEDNGTVEIDVSIGNDESDNFTWKTHPLHLKNYSADNFINVVSGAMKAANELDEEYSAFNNWQNDLINAKEDRKSSYYDYPEISPEDKAKSRQDRKQVKRDKYDAKQKEKAEEAALQEEHRTKRHDDLSNPFEGLSLSPVASVKDGKKTIKISRECWASIGKQAGWSDGISNTLSGLKTIVREFPFVVQIIKAMKKGNISLAKQLANEQGIPWNSVFGAYQKIQQTASNNPNGIIKTAGILTEIGNIGDAALRGAAVIALTLTFMGLTPNGEASEINHLSENAPTIQQLEQMQGSVDLGDTGDLPQESSNLGAYDGYIQKLDQYGQKLDQISSNMPEQTPEQINQNSLQIAQGLTNDLSRIITNNQGIIDGLSGVSASEQKTINDGMSAFRELDGLLKDAKNVSPDGLKKIINVMKTIETRLHDTFLAIVKR
jgi:hypothetical protein